MSLFLVAGDQGMFVHHDRDIPSLFVRCFIRLAEVAVVITTSVQISLIGNSLQRRYCFQCLLQREVEVTGNQAQSCSSTIPPRKARIFLTQQCLGQRLNHFSATKQLLQHAFLLQVRRDTRSHLEGDNLLGSQLDGRGEPSKDCFLGNVGCAVEAFLFGIPELQRVQVSFTNLCVQPGVAELTHRQFRRLTSLEVIRLQQTLDRVHRGIGQNDRFPVGRDRDAVRWSHEGDRGIAPQTPQVVDDVVVLGAVLLTERHRVHHVAIAQVDLLAHGSPEVGDRIASRAGRQGQGDQRICTIDAGLDLAEDEHLMDQLQELLLVLHLDAKRHGNAGLIGWQGHDLVDRWFTAFLHRGLGDSVNSLVTQVMRHHLEVVGVGERSLTAQTKTTSGLGVATLGGIAVDPVDRADLGMGDTEAEITHGQLSAGEGDLQRGIGLACSDVGIPTVTDDLAHHSQLRVGVQGGGQDVHQGCVIAYAHFHGFLVAYHGVRDEIVLLGDLHDLSFG